MHIKSRFGRLNSLLNEQILARETTLHSDWSTLNMRGVYFYDTQLEAALTDSLDIPFTDLFSARFGCLYKPYGYLELSYGTRMALFHKGIWRVEK